MSKNLNNKQCRLRSLMKIFFNKTTRNIFVFTLIIFGFSLFTNQANATTPDQISGLSLWLKADAITGLNDGDLVSTWSDSRSNGNNVTQSSGDLKPTYKTNIINGKPVLRFLNDKLVASGSIYNQHQPFTIFTVLKTGATSRMVPFSNADVGGQNGMWADFYHPNSNLETVFGTSSYSSIGTVTSGEWNYYSFDINATSQTTYKLGNVFGAGSITIANQGSISTSPFVVGTYSATASTMYFNGDIAEIIIYSGALSDTDRNSIESYLSGKYSLASPPLLVPTVTITSPTTNLTVHDQFYNFAIPWIQTSTTLNVTATGANLVSGGGIEFILDKGTASETSIKDLSSLYSASFTNVAKGNHTIDAYALDSDGTTRVSNSEGHQQLTNIGIGDIIALLGDSTTAGHGGHEGSGNVTTCAQATYKTADCRTYEQTDGDSSSEPWASFHVELATKLEAYYGYPVFIMNEGWGSTNAYQILNNMLPQAQIQNRLIALKPNKWLINEGHNDAGCLTNPGYSYCTAVGYTPTIPQYETEMQGIINEIKTRYSATNDQIYLARFSYDTRIEFQTTTPSPNDFLNSVQNLININTGIKRGPDIWDYFTNHVGTGGESLLSDVVHPNVAGYTQVARLWEISLMQPQNISISQNTGTITLNWNSLSSVESTIAGYKVKYGTTSGIYSTTIDVGNVTSKTITGLVDGQTYYFAVSAYDNDATLVNETQNSSEVNLTYNNDITPRSTTLSTPSAGIYNSTQSVTLSATGSDYIKYSLTETPATCSAGILYSDSTPISIATSSTIYVRACDNAGNSSTQSFAYVIDSEAPSTAIATPVAGTYSSAQTISLTSAGSDSIRYSITETPATCSSGTLYTTPISVSTSQTIYVRACDTLTNFSTTNFAYIISRPTSSGSSASSRYNNLISMGNLQAAENLKKEFSNQFSNNQIPLAPSIQTTSTVPSTPIIINRILRLTTPRIWGDDIKALQTFLNTKGYDSGTPDGNFGPKTQTAVIAFQKSNGLTPDGVVGPKTVKFMNDSQPTSSIPTPLKTRILKLSTPRMIGDDVKALQTYLSEKGYDAGIPDGIFGNKTKTAIIAFQTANSLTPDGLVGAKTREMMK